MAFTSTEKTKLRWYLGYSDRFHQVDSELEQAMLAIGDEAVTLIQGSLTRLDNIVAGLTDSYSRLKAMKVGSIELPGGNEIGLLRSEGRRIVGQMASTLGVCVRHDVFKPSGPGGSERIPY